MKNTEKLKEEKELFQARLLELINSFQDDHNLKVKKIVIDVKHFNESKAYSIKMTWSKE